MPSSVTGKPGTIRLGGTLEIKRIGFGTIYLTAERGFGFPRANARVLLRQTVDLGVNLIDTADSYGPGYREDPLR
jgi:pyridoxine 4-dehydrogenase